LHIKCLSVTGATLAGDWHAAEKAGMAATAFRNARRDWVPAAEMIRRRRYLPRWVAAGPGKPPGARGPYLGHTQYGIHGTNDSTPIGSKTSSGCVRLTHDHVVDLNDRALPGADLADILGRPRHQDASRGEDCRTA
jgi:lipoprotein-anchoring transpeptidase ErfK/SrfK